MGKAQHHHQFKTAVVTLKSGLKIDVTTARLVRGVEMWKYLTFAGVLSAACLTANGRNVVSQNGSVSVHSFISHGACHSHRRDFTINAMAMQLNKGQFGRLLDFFHGAPS